MKKEFFWKNDVFNIFHFQKKINILKTNRLVPLKNILWNISRLKWDNIQDWDPLNHSFQYFFNVGQQVLTKYQYMQVPLNNMVPNTWCCYISWNSKIIQLHDSFEKFQKKHIIDLKIHIFDQHICWPLVNSYCHLYMKIRIHILKV